MEWFKLFSSDISLNVQTKTLPTEGNLVYEYNPLRNYRITQNMYEYKNQLYSLGDLWNLFRISINCTAYRYKKNNIYNYKINDTSSSTWNPEEISVEVTTSPTEFGNWIEEAYSEGHNAERKNLESALINSEINNAWYNVPTTETDPYLCESGELMDFSTNELNFSIEHPVYINPQASYDGSVNLILNDGVNVPRLINTRFSTTGKNTYKVVDRKGNNDTNIYDQGEQFDIDTSLYKRVLKIPKIEFKGVFSGGNLKVGNYHFYFKLSDADGNETDFIGESGLVSVFIGFNDYYSVHTGQKNENSFKQVNFQLKNLDSSYDYVHVYYSRSTAELGENLNTEYAKIDKKFLINNASLSDIIITGYESIIQLTSSDINLNYNTVDSVVTSTTCQNILFLANVHKPNIPYEELTDLSLRFLPYLKQEVYTADTDQNYNISTSNKGYLDPLYIYDKTGYWGKEIYRFGIVYILPNGELSPVFNIRGAYNIEEFKQQNNQFYYIDSQYTNIPVFVDEEGIKTRNYINYNEETYIISGYNNSNSYENIKGVVSFSPSRDTSTIYSVDIRVDDVTIEELKKYVKGYFFVRQSRIPTILAQGITIGIDKESKTPTIPTADGFLAEMAESLDKTHATTEDINDVNFISEGFLNRYSFEFKKKSSSLFGSILKAAAIGVGIVALAAATVFTAGAVGAAAAGVALSGAVTAGATTLGTIAGTIAGTIGVGASLGTVGAVAVGAGAVGAAAGLSVAVAGGIQELRYGVSSIFAKKTLNGRNTQAPSGYKIVESEDSRKLTQDFKNRFIPKDINSNFIAGILCPDYEVDQAKYNQIFTGNEHLIELTNSQNINCLNGHSYNYFTNKGRHFYVPSYYDRNISTCYNMKIIPVPDNTKCVGLDNMTFRSRAGDAEEAWRYECVAEDYKSEYSKKTDTEDSETVSNKKINTDIIRGSFGAYLAINDKTNKFQPAETVNIYIPGYSTVNIQNYFYLRMIDNSAFSAITERYDISDLDNYLVNSSSNIVGLEDRSCGYQFAAYRGDCYICQFTHRVLRNFNDPSAPYNDDIVDENSWKDHYDPSNTEEYENINLGDVNAIQLGMWVTFRVRSSYNLNIRTLDSSNVDEKQMTGHARGYYPYHPMDTDGSYKIPESHTYNKGFSKSLSERYNSLLPDVPYIKNWFGTRIMYSDIHINDAYKNGFRVFRRTKSVDYTREYGEIVKLISLNSNLLIIFEHGVAIAPVNQQAVQQSAGQLIATSRVLPEAPIVISDMFGSQWADSVLKVPGLTGDSKQYVYGVDTVAKKIWRTDGQTLSCISDFRVQEFLNNNITLSERELTPKLGVRNVKTCYNAYKRDVLFTFYDNTDGFQEKVWNLCWNELLEKFITFYSWVPSFMENIDNVPFSFNRDTSKWISKLGITHSTSSFADGVTLTNVEFDSEREGKATMNYKFPIQYLNKQGKTVTVTGTVVTTDNFVGILGLANRVFPDSNMFYDIKYELCRDIWGNYKNFKIATLKVHTSSGDLDYFPLGSAQVGTEDALLTGNMYIYGLFMNNDQSLYVRDTSSAQSNQLTYLTTHNSSATQLYFHRNMNSKLLSELYYRNIAGHAYSDDVVNRIRLIANKGDKVEIEQYDGTTSTMDATEYLDLPIYKNKQGKREMLPRDQQLNADSIVKLLNIKATIEVTLPGESSLNDYYYNKKASYEFASYESTVAIIPQRNMQFLTTDFWKHGQAGIYDIADDIYPTYWYGKQHPFEFEVVVVNDPAIHKIFTNLELVANKAKPESFHYEVIGESYDFAKDKANMYFRQEALKALWQYNGCDIEYNSDFLKVQTRQQAKSADLPHNYYARRNGLNEVEDYYVAAQVGTHDYRHLSGGEIVYYPNRQEFRVWNHALAVDVDDQPDTTDSAYGGRGLMASNMRYLEDRWKVQINPLLITYKNEYIRKDPNKALCIPENSTWKDAVEEGVKLPPLPLYNSPIPDEIKSKGEIAIPGYSINSNGAYATSTDGKDNAMYNLYKVDFTQDIHPFDTDSWLDDVSIYKYNFGSAQNRKETDMRDKFIKIRIRYSGEELAVIDFLNTVYQISYA